MQQVQEKAVEFIRDSLVEGSVKRFQNYLTSISGDEKTNDDQDSINSNKIIELDPSKTNQIIPPAFMVALGSVAGSGKTTLAKKIGQTFNTTYKNVELTSNKNNNSKNIIKVIISETIVLPMDGYHRYRTELSAMKDPEEAFRRRGAPYTFNDEKYAANMEQLRKTGKLSAPEFDHAKKDPEEDAIHVDVKTRYYYSTVTKESQESTESSYYIVYRPLIIVEGIYCLYDDGDLWAHALNQYDDRIYLKIPIDNATERLTKRHMRAWGISEADARLRAAGSDRDNGLLVIARAEKLASSGRCLVLETVEDEEFCK